MKDVSTCTAEIRGRALWGCALLSVTLLLLRSVTLQVGEGEEEAAWGVSAPEGIRGCLCPREAAASKWFKDQNHTEVVL